MAHVSHFECNFCSRRNSLRFICSRVPWKNPMAADLGKFRVIFSVILKMVYCVYSSESPQ